MAIYSALTPGYLTQFFKANCMLSVVKYISTSKIVLAEPAPKKKDKIFFDWRDPLNFESGLNESERLLKKKVQEFCEAKLFPRIKEATRESKLHKEIFREFGDLEILGCAIKGFGCAGVTSVGYGLVTREIERVDSSYRSAMSVQGLAMDAINMYGSKEQKEEYLPKMAKGEMVGCFALTEPEHGSDIAHLETKAEHNKEKKVYILNGSKKWITNAPVADLCIVWARCEDNNIRGFIVHTRDKGVSITEIEGKFSLRASPTGKIDLQNVEIPENRLLDGTQGLKNALVALTNARYGISWGALGAAEFCLQASLEYSLKRVQFRRPIASYQLVQTKLADMATEIALGLQSCYQVGRLKDQDMISPELISLLKRNSCAKALNIARKARDLMGGNGITLDYHIIRHVMNLESVNTYEGTHDIHGLILGKAITGLQAFKN